MPLSKSNVNSPSFWGGGGFLFLENAERRKKEAGWIPNRKCYRFNGTSTSEEFDLALKDLVAIIRLVIEACRAAEAEKRR